MRRLETGRLISAIVMVCSALFVFSTTWRCEAEERGDIDLSATLKYVRDWAARSSFPESPSLAYQNIFCQLALDGQLSDADAHKVIEFLVKCQRPDGGFVSDPELKQGSNVIPTYYALAALDIVDAASSIDRKKAVGFVMSLVQKDGGIRASLADKEANLGTTYYGIRALHMLKALDRIDKNRTIAYIRSYRDGTKGFGVRPGKPSTPQSTFMAVASMKLLGGLTEDITRGAVRYLTETPYGGIKEPENVALMTIESTAYIVETAAILSALQQLNAERICEFLESLYIPQNGGFGPSTGLGSTPPSTFYAIVCLAKLGKLQDPNPAHQ